MKHLLTMFAAALFALVVTTRDGNAVVIDPIAGASGEFRFDLGETTVSFPVVGGDGVLSFTLLADSILDILVTDCCIPDDLSLLVDGVDTAWLEVGQSFSLIGLALAAGAHTIDFGIDDYCCDTAQGGKGTYEIRGVAAAVPLPAALPLLGAGLFGLGVLRLRRRKAA